LVNGCLQAPDKPGHGVNFNWEKLAACLISR
jgi:hypothetical protein